MNKRQIQEEGAFPNNSECNRHYELSYAAEICVTKIQCYDMQASGESVVTNATNKWALLVGPAWINDVQNVFLFQNYILPFHWYSLTNHTVKGYLFDHGFHFWNSLAHPLACWRTSDQWRAVLENFERAHLFNVVEQFLGTVSIFLVEQELSHTQLSLLQPALQSRGVCAT